MCGMGASCIAGGWLNGSGALAAPAEDLIQVSAAPAAPRDLTPSCGLLGNCIYTMHIQADNIHKIKINKNHKKI